MGERGRAAVAPPVRCAELPGPPRGGQPAASAPHGASAAGIPVGAGRRPRSRCSPSRPAAAEGCPQVPAHPRRRDPAGSDRDRNLGGGIFRGHPPAARRASTHCLWAAPAAGGTAACPLAASLPAAPPGNKNHPGAARGHRHPPAKPAPRREAGGGAALPLARLGPSLPAGRRRRRRRRPEAGPRGAVAPVGALRAAGSLLLQLPRRAGIREPGRV